MVQSFIGGMTNYDDQSLVEIKSDLNAWKIYSENISSLFQEKLECLKQRGYINNIPYNLVSIFYETIRKTQTFIHDIDLIEKSIKDNLITKREIHLLEKIGIVGNQTNLEYGKVYHEDSAWREYGEENFMIAENLYAEGRDYFVSLQDALNASNRLHDYIDTKSVNNTNFINNGSVNNLLQGNNNSIVIENQSNGQNYDEINTLLEKISDNLDDYFNENQLSEKNEARECIELIQKEFNQEKPRTGILKSLLNGLPMINNSIEFANNITEVTEKIYSLF